MDLLNGKVFDGSKKGTACPLWRLHKNYYNNGIKQVLPEKPVLKYNFRKCRIKKKNPMAQWIKPKQIIPRRAVRCRVCNAIFIWNPRRKNQDLCRIHASSFYATQRFNLIKEQA
jgi:hypothetical protein